MSTAPNPNAAPAAIDTALLSRLARTIRGLAIDGVEAAKSGHPGMPLGCADFAALLWGYHLTYNPADPKWPNRDRFVLSAGHGSMLLYSVLHLAGYNLPLDELRRFRQIGSKTPGHPENFLTEGVETTTGPLGQGFGNGAGMALAAAMMNARFGDLADHTVYGIVSDGDLMEGVAAEAASFAGHHQLGRIVYFYDDNKISIEGETHLTFSREDVAARFEAYGWHVQKVNGHDFAEMHRALAAAKAETTRPSIIIGRTHIGYGSPKQDSEESHGSPLGPEATKQTKVKLGLDPEKSFAVTDEDRAFWAARAAAGAAAQKAWQAKLAAAEPAVRAAFEAHHAKPLPDLKALRPKNDGKAAATRKSAGVAESAYAPALPWLVGGSADLAPSTNTWLKGSPAIGPGQYEGRNIHFGVREHGMGAIMNGMALHGTFTPFGATFLVFSDYMRPSVRLAALMGVQAIYVFTHDSIFLGEDGPTHQAVEHVAALRAIPNLNVIRPGDADEAAIAWETAIRRTDGPTALILSRQNLPDLAREAKKYASAEELARGGYILRDSAKAPQVILIATGSELHLAVEAANKLDAEGIAARVVSMPCLDIFQAQPKEYRDAVLPPAVRKRVVVEAGIRQGWEAIATDEGAFVTQDGFGQSAPAEVLAKEYGFTVDNVVARAKGLLGR